MFVLPGVERITINNLAAMRYGIVGTGVGGLLACWPIVGQMYFVQKRL